MKNFKTFTFCFLFFVIPFLSVGCASNGNQSTHASMSAKSEGMYQGPNSRVTALSEEGLYKVSLHSTRSPVPIGEIHSWVVHVETSSGEIFENGKVFVSGGMPMHRHGFPTRPVTKEYLGNGDYRVEGIKFNMRGHWEIRFVIKTKQGHNRDRVVFNINL